MDVEASGPPYGMSPALPAFHRATRIAEALFGGTEASVALVDGARVWRSGGSLVGKDTKPLGVMYVLEHGRQSWLADLDADPLLKAQYDTTRPYARFWAGAPVRLADGTTIGVLTVMGLEPRAYDKALAARLQDLADGVADECDRAKAAAIAAERDRELRAARKGMAAFVGSVPIESVMTDKDLR